MSPAKWRYIYVLRILYTKMKKTFSCESMNPEFLRNPKSDSEMINDFLSSRKGLHYLCMKYPKLSVKEAISEFEKTYYQQYLV